MTTDDLRAAEGRLRRLGDGEPIAQAYRAHPSPHLAHAKDVAIVVHAYLAEHPAAPETRPARGDSRAGSFDGAGSAG